MRLKMCGEGSIPSVPQVPVIRRKKSYGFMLEHTFFIKLSGEKWIDDNPSESCVIVFPRKRQFA